VSGNDTIEQMLCPEVLATPVKQNDEPEVVEQAEDGVSKSLESSVVTNGNGVAAKVESVADILERELHAVIPEWLVKVENAPDLMTIKLSSEERTGHLPQLLRDVIARFASGQRGKGPDFAGCGPTRRFAA
jgi:hypothetical protein